MFSDHFDVLMSKIIFLKKYYFNVFWNKKHFKDAFVSRKIISGKPFSKLSCVCLPIGKLVNEKHFPVKEKFSLISKKVFSFYFGLKTLFRSCEKFKNIILFADYVKFGPQTFDCYIFYLNLFFFKFIP